jgi:hypothetical protein
LSQIGQIQTSISPSSIVETLTGNTGGPVGPTAGNINVIGAGNITVTGNPGTSTETITITGTTNHAVQVGNTSGGISSIPVGLTGQVLTGVTGADPVFAAAASSSISITGDTGGALVGNAFTFTGGTTGLLFNGGGTTETLGGTLIVSNGGTGRATLTNHGILIGAGTTAITQSAVGATNTVLLGNTGADPSFGTVPNAALTNSSITLNNGNNITFSGTTPLSLGGTGSANLTGTTNHAVQIGNSSGSLTSVAVGTTGQVLTGVTGSDPVFSAPAASSISITGDSGGALIGSAFTFTGGTTGLLFGGSGSTETLGGTLVVANGGTGAVTLTSHGVLLGNTTSAITATIAGTTGQILTGVTGSAPTFQSPAASSISITGNTGGALVGSAFTFTGGTTGLTFAGSGSTETLGGTLIVANGGTGQTTLTNHGVLIGAGTTAITQSAVGGTGTVLIGNSSADPTFSATPTVTSIQFGGSSPLSFYAARQTWTPTYNGSTTSGTTTYTTQLGYYSVIGDIVVINFFLAGTAATGTGNIVIGGLPEVVVNVAGYFPIGCLITSGIVFPTGTTSISLVGNPNTITCNIYGSGSAVNNAIAQMSNVAFSVVGSLTYFF